MRAHFRLTMATPRMEFVIHVHTTRLAWPIDNQASNAHARTSLASLRPRGAWVLQSGMNCSGVFHAIQPTEPPTALGMSITLNVEAIWHTAFVNTTGDSGNRHILISTRPPGGTPNWGGVYRGPITVVRLCDVAEPVVNHTAAGAEPSPAVQEEVEAPAAASSSSGRPTGDGRRFSCVFARSSNRRRSSPRSAVAYPAPNVIPFPDHAEASHVARPTTPPIALFGVDPCGLSEFEF